VPYASHWPARFSEASLGIRDAVGSLAMAIEHVGSTAVPGLAGKPVLDIAIAVADQHAADACIKPLEALGYRYRGPNGDDLRRRYYTRDVDGERAEQIHLYMLPATAYTELLHFRDALRADSTLATEYANEKLRVAAAVNWDKTAYSIGKGEFVQAVLRTHSDSQQVHAD
jgi:GrpB-like predicted nucleotidyltransferase (UPF0157 family)